MRQFKATEARRRAFKGSDFKIIFFTDNEGQISNEFHSSSKLPILDLFTFRMRLTLATFQIYTAQL